MTHATHHPTRHVDVVIVGGGAAGLMCALTAGQRELKVLVIEHANRVGKKILMSGGGRCNFTNTGTTPANYLSNNPHFCKSALAGTSSTVRLSKRRSAAAFLSHHTSLARPP